MTRQYAKSVGVRRTILEACSTVFSESGFHGASMADIARRAGVSYTGLLHHFPRKENLLTGVIALQDERSERYLRDHGSFADDADPLEILAGMLHTLVVRERFVGLVELSAVLTGEATVKTHPAHDYFAGRYGSIRSFLTRLFESLEAEGRLHGGLPPEQLAVATLALTEGAHKQWLYDEHRQIDVDAVVTGVLGTFVPDLAPQSAE